MNDSHDIEFRRLSLALFVAGFLVPFIIAIFSIKLAIGFCVVSEILAFLFASFSKRGPARTIVLAGVVCMGILCSVCISYIYLHELKAQRKVTVNYTRDSIQSALIG